MSEHPVVGPLFSPHLLERSVLVVLRKRLPGYLTIACELNDIPEGIEAVKSWGLESDLPDDWPSQGMPALLIVSNGTIGNPDEGQGGTYAATWGCDVVITVKAAKGPAARRYAQTYGAAIRGALLQRRTLGQPGQSARWLGETPGMSVPDEDDSESSVCSVVNRFGIRRQDVVSWRKGPGPEGPPIPDDWPKVTEIDTETEMQDP